LPPIRTGHTSMGSKTAIVIPFHPRRRTRLVVRILFVLATACATVAIAIQDHTSYLPLGVFNTGARQLSRLADALLVLGVVALVAQVVELRTGRFSRACGWFRGVVAFVCILNVLLVFGDRLFVTGNPAGLLGQYYEVPSTGRHPVILKKAFGGIARDPCFLRPDASDGPRVLFLGDSYTEGSGRARECNYPNVVERVLREKWNANARVVNAGVSGYGPVEALNLLRWQRALGCPIDAIVYNLVLENDFADNLPRTERRVVAGIISRFPRSWFLRTFHPLNMRTFRWAMILTFFARASTHEMLNAVTVDEGPCDLAPDSLRTVSPFLRATVERGLTNARRIAAVPHARDEALDAIREMKAIADELGVPFAVVVFPDRVLADHQLWNAISVSNDDLNLLISNVNNIGRGVGPVHVIDLFEELYGHGPGMYRAADTHLSDLGNVIAGEYVGTVLARALNKEVRG
jgi:hypothetical protein